MYRQNIKTLQHLLGSEGPFKQVTKADINAIENLLKYKRKDNRIPIILRQPQAPGDIVMLTACVRDFIAAHGTRYRVDVRTTSDDLWKHNPHITPIEDTEPGVVSIDMEYPLIHKCNDTPYHFIHAFRKFLESKLNLDIPQGAFKGDITLSEEELTWLPQVEEYTKKPTNYWLINAGAKTDFTCKTWAHSSYQTVADYLNSKGVQVVQIGLKEETHKHKALTGVLNLVGKTTLRELIRLVYHSSGVITPVSLPMHLAAAVPVKPALYEGLRPCIVIAGGREPAHWEQYPGHQFLQTIGQLDCCADGGCWRSRVVPLGDGDSKDKTNLCAKPIEIESGQIIPTCMDNIRPEDVIRSLQAYGF